MERNLMFDTDGLNDIAVRLAWAQLEIFADDVQKVQVLVAGDERSVEDLRILIKDGALVVEQPQYGLSISNFTESTWMQVCVRVPRGWDREIHASTIGGLLSARKLNAGKLVLDTVSGDLRALQLNAPTLKLRTVSGDVHAEGLICEGLQMRAISSDLNLDGVQTKTVKGTSVSGSVLLCCTAPYESVELTTVSGDITIAAPVETANVNLRSISGKVKLDGVTETTEDSAPTVRVTGVSADLTLRKA